ncbi:MAG TPA: hypothetical protein VE800_10185 [Actinomycetota bacterium]|nr:hypothetical protein [Actinomycetota bacterium]
MDTTRRREPPSQPHGDRVPDGDEAEELVDETIDESFPASDPPSYWGRETSGGDDDEQGAGRDE